MIYLKIMIAQSAYKFITLGVRQLKKAMTSLIAMGIGATAIYGLAQKNDNMTKKMKKSMRKAAKALF